MGALAGIAGPLLFSLAFTAQGLMRRGEYDPVAEPVSALEAGPRGWLQQLNFVVFGALLLAFAVGLHRSTAPSRFGRAGTALLSVSAAGLFLAAAFPLREDATGTTYDPGGHFLAGVTFFLGSALALLALAGHLRADPRWRGLSSYLLVAGLVALACFVALGRFAIPDGAPLHDYAGLLQRATILLVTFPCFVVLGLRMLRIARPRRP